MASFSVPKYIVEYFLRGRTRPGAVERFTQTGGMVSDVWFEFANDLTKPVRVLIAPTEGVTAVDVGGVLHTCIMAYRSTPEANAISIYVQPRTKLSVSPLENFVAATFYFDELLHVVLPLTMWWNERHLSRLNTEWNKDGEVLQGLLIAEIKAHLGHGQEPAQPARPARTRRRKDALSQDAETAIAARQIREAVPIAALIGAFLLVQRDPEFFTDAPPVAPRDATAEERFADWLRLKHRAQDIAVTAVAAMAREIPHAVFNPEKLSPSSEQAAKAIDPDRRDPPALISRVFLDRKAELAVTEGVSTIKADAAKRVFEVSCRNLTWAIIDSGIDATHPAFANHDPKRRQPTRIRAILDFTPIEQIRNFGLTEHEPDSPGQEQAIRAVIDELLALPDYPEIADFEATAAAHLRQIAEQLRQRLQPDWNLIEPLIRRRPPKPDEAEPDLKIVSGHGTHVAGILGADWRENESNPPEKSNPRGKSKKREQSDQLEQKIVLRGVCPDINLYDLRVIDPVNHKSTEFAVLAALEYVQFANRRIAGMKQVIHGVNISLSIPHEVRTYACGSTPICLACNSLVGAGVVVVAAAGNRGWSEQEIGFGNFVFCSITDPGNAEDVITVGATHRQRPHTYGVSYFSSRGPTGDGRTKPDLVAPGEKIKGPILDNADDELDGTSMAAPFVSGAAAMLIARHGELVGNPRRIKQVLCESATDLGREKYFQGHGLLDVLRALQSV